MRVGQKVMVVNCAQPMFEGMQGVITQCIQKIEWDDKDNPEYLVDLGLIDTEDTDDLSLADLFFTAAELEAI